MGNNEKVYFVSVDGSYDGMYASILYVWQKNYEFMGFGKLVMHQI